MKKCSRCKVDKELDCFYIHVRTKDGYCSYCIECDKKAKADYYQRTKEATIARASRFASENPDKVRGYKRKWKQANPDKLRQYKHKRRSKESVEHFTAQQWQDLLERYNHQCLSCGTKDKLSADHVTPLASGGSNSIDNIQPLCVDCNCKKGLRTTDYREI